MKIENGELSQFAKTAEGISYAFYDIRKNSDALDDLSRVVAKLDSDTLETAEQQAAVATEQARRICNLEDSNLDIIADLRGFDTLAMEFSDMKGIGYGVQRYDRGEPVQSRQWARGADG